MTGGLRVGPGQTVEATYPAATAGHHNVEVSAYGIAGGCISGELRHAAPPRPMTRETGSAWAARTYQTRTQSISMSAG